MDALRRFNAWTAYYNYMVAGENCTANWSIELVIIIKLYFLCNACLESEE